VADEADPTAVRDEIEREIRLVLEDSYGAGARAVQVHLSDEFVLIFLDVELTPAEQTLMDAGKTEAVKQTRESYQEAIGPTFTALIERATGRRVASFLSTISLDPLYSVEIFRLSPA
jgi:uncharacterized protein YbcI